MTTPLSIVIATGNPGKVRELEQLLAEIPVTLKGLTDFPGITDVDETGSTFAENAELKAVGYARQTSRWTLADDSGLEVAALGGRPGVHSARYGGDVGFEEKWLLLLEEMSRSGNGRRDARFVCSMVLADETGRVLFTAEGECRGQIAPEPRGRGGFGYDPIFVPEGFDKTFGELPDQIKAQISHRARASAKIIRYLLDFTGRST
jgi:XTP/dITP diphosphohydrolase